MNPLHRLGDGLNVAVVGASGGLGSAFVDHLAAAPNVQRIYALSRRKGEATGQRIEHHTVDVTDESSIEACASTIAEPLHAVIIATGFLHNETIRPEKSLRDLNAATLAVVYAVNCIGPSLVMKHFIPKLPREGRSVLAALSAKVGSIGDNQLGGWHAYRAAKASLNMIIRNAAIETARRLPQAVIIGVHPGTVDTALSKPFQPRDPSYQIFPPTVAAQNILNVMDHVSPDQSGMLINWDGRPLPF